MTIDLVGIMLLIIFLFVYLSILIWCCNFCFLSASFFFIIIMIIVSFVLVCLLADGVCVFVQYAIQNVNCGRYEYTSTNYNNTNLRTKNRYLLFFVNFCCCYLFSRWTANTVAQITNFSSINIGSNGLFGIRTQFVIKSNTTRKTNQNNFHDENICE